MKTIPLTVLIAVLFTFCVSRLQAQNEYLDLKLRDTVPDENFTIFNLNDFRDALVQLGINVYKWNLPIPHDKDYHLKFYIQEYEKKKLIKDTVVMAFGTKVWGFAENDRAEYQYIRNLRIISEMPDWRDKTDKLRFRITLNSRKFGFGESILPRQEYGLYYLRKFEETDFAIGKDIPLPLFTAGWETNMGGKLVRQYCGPNFPPADLNDSSFEKSDHYFVFGYRVMDEDFQGRE